MAQGQSEAVTLTGFALGPSAPRAYVTKVNVGPRQAAQEGTGRESRRSSEWDEQIVKETGINQE